MMVDCIWCEQPEDDTFDWIGSNHRACAKIAEERTSKGCCPYCGVKFIRDDFCHGCYPRQQPSGFPYP